MIYPFINLHAKEASVTTLCRLFSVSRSSYYIYQQRLTQPVEPCRISPLLKAAFTQSGKTYGSRRLRIALQKQGVCLGLYAIRKQMKQQRLIPIWKPKFVNTTDSNHDLPVAENILNRQFTPASPNQAWVTDITYIRTQRGWLYLATVMDLYSRRIIGWAMAPTMPAELVCSALQMAVTYRQPAIGLIVHSDRGSQYASEAYQSLLKRHGFICSMSRKGNCWDNAVMERFFLNLKMERVWQRDYANHSEAIKDITDYLVNFYNSHRIHSTFGYLSPIDYESQFTAKTPIVVSENT